MRKILRCVADSGSYFELKARFGKAAVTALARLGGKTVGLVANNPLYKGGALDADACDKIVSFLVLCDSYNIPLVMFVDTPGFAIGVEAERKRAPGKIMVEIDLSSVEPSIAGPRRPNERLSLTAAPAAFRDAYPTKVRAGTIKDGDIMIAAIASCTNTSNPSVMIGAGLLARNAVARG